MTDYTTSEQSLTSGQPVELYEFHLGETETYWRYTSAGYAITYAEHEFIPVYIKRTHIEMSDNSLRNGLQVEVDWRNPFAWQYRTTPWDGIINFTLYRGHDPNFVVHWRGKVTGVQFKGGRLATIGLSPLINDLERSCQAMRYGRSCCVTLYSTLCGVSKPAYTVRGVVDSVSGVLVTSTTFSEHINGWFNGGYLDCNGYTRKIVEHLFDTVRLATAIPGLGANMPMTTCAGCDHSWECCLDRFNNLDNYRGQPFIPNRNPFGVQGIA